VFFLKKTKKESYEKASRRSRGARSRQLPKKQKRIPNPEGKVEKKEAKGGGPTTKAPKRQLYNEMVVKACLLKHSMDPYREKLRDAIKKVLRHTPKVLSRRRQD
jgi:hypothetical protein